MLLLIQIWVATAILVWGVVLTLVGLGTHGLIGGWIRPVQYPGESKLCPTLLGVGTAALGLALFVSALGWSSLRDAYNSLVTGALFLLGIHLATGYARFEYNLSPTMLKNPRQDAGIFSRFLGAVAIAVSLFVLAVSLNVFGWKVPLSSLIVRIIEVSATLFAAILVNVLTGSAVPRRPVLKLLVTVTGVIVFALLISQTPGLIGPSSTPVPSPTIPQTTTATPGPITPPTGQIEIVSSKTVLHVGEQTVLTVSVDPTTPAPTFRWRADYGTVPSDWVPTPSVTYVAPNFTTVDTIRVTVRDANGKQVATGEIKMQIVQ